MVMQVSGFVQKTAVPAGPEVSDLDADLGSCELPEVGTGKVG